MPCNKLTSLTGCNTCNFYVNDNRLLRTLRPEAIARVCLYLVKSDAIAEKIIDFDNITVSCSGSITYSRKITDITDTYIILRQNIFTCGKIIDRWCKEHPSELNTIVGCTMVNISNNINAFSDMYAIREYFTNLVKYLRNITICNKMCDVVTINKVISNCTFTLGDDKELRKINDPIVILEALSQAIYAYKVSSVKKAYVDISCIKVKCDGTVILPSKYVYADNPISHIIEGSIDILREWVSRHRYHRAVLYILDTIEVCKEAENTKDLHKCLQRSIGFIEGFIFF